MSEEQVNLGLSLGHGGASDYRRNLSSFPAPPHLSLASFPLAPPCLKPLPASQRSAVAAGSPRCSLFPAWSSDGRHRHSGNCSSFKGIDVNREPTAGMRKTTKVDGEGDGVSSPNSSVSSAVSGGGGCDNKGDERGQTGNNIWDANALERTLSLATNDEDDAGEGSQNRKLRLSAVQAAVLEESFKVHHTLNPRQKLALAKQLHLRPRQVEVWFQNRRARTKLKQTEVDCELLRRCCENLTEDNRRLQKEVQELRDLKLLVPKHHLHVAPPTTLTFCPSCERVAPAVNPKPAAVAASLLAATAGPNQLPQFPDLHRPHGFSPGHFLPMQRRTVPAASTGHSFPWIPASRRATALADAPTPP